MEKDGFFYWACPVLHSINYTTRQIAEILNEQGYSCGKSTVYDAMNRYKKVGTPLLLKRGLTGIGK